MYSSGTTLRSPEVLELLVIPILETNKVPIQLRVCNGSSKGLAIDIESSTTGGHGHLPYSPTRPPTMAKKPQTLAHLKSCIYKCYLKMK